MADDSANLEANYNNQIRVNSLDADPHAEQIDD